MYSLLDLDICKLLDKHKEYSEMHLSDFKGGTVSHAMLQDVAI